MQTYSKYEIPLSNVFTKLSKTENRKGVKLFDDKFILLYARISKVIHTDIYVHKTTILPSIWCSTRCVFDTFLAILSFVRETLMIS